MEKLKAILVDDEFFARENLKMLLEDYAKENIELIGPTTKTRTIQTKSERGKYNSSLSSQNFF